MNPDEDVKVLATIVIPKPQDIPVADREKVVEILTTALDHFKSEATEYDCDRLELAVCDDEIEFFITVTAMKETAPPTIPGDDPTVEVTSEGNEPAMLQGGGRLTKEDFNG